MSLVGQPLLIPFGRQWSSCKVIGSYSQGIHILDAVAKELKAELCLAQPLDLTHGTI
jgi:hypothetical protein